MPKALAINTVQICKAPAKLSPEGKVLEPAVIETKLPGSVFSCGDKDYADFLAAGAVRAPTRVDEAAAGPAEPAA